LFIAAWPSAETTVRLAGFIRPTEPGVRWVPRDNWHVTLRFIGEAEIDQVVSSFEHTGFPRAVARLGPTIERLDRRQLVIPVEGVDALAESVQAATSDIGEPDRRRFRGHLTIARLKPNAASSVRGTHFEAQFDIDEIALVASDLLPSGAVYRTVATFPTSVTD
jgi:2'-5' RNA ligase